MKSRAVLLFALCLSLCLSAFAQTSRGTVNGVVTDTAGAVVSGATVVLTNAATNVSRTTSANAEGFYRFDAVELGVYSVKVTASGFSALIKSNLTVSANLTATVDAALAPGTTEMSVDITAESGALLQTEAPVRGGNINAMSIVDLPIAGRNPVSLALTLPGVSTNRFGFGVGTFSVNGSRGRSNNFLIDGTENNDISIGGQGFQIKNPDAVQEVSVQTSNFDSEFGRAGGAVTNVITKAGTNGIHGTASWQYDSTRDDALTNTQSLSPALQTRGYAPYGTEHFFTGTIGGPVKLPKLYDGKDRTFFFVSYLNQRQASNSTATVFVPSAAGRATLRGLAAAGVNPRLDSLLAVTDGTVGVASLRNIALGNNRPDVQFGTAVTAFAQTFVEPQMQYRIDHKVSEKSQLQGRYLYSDQNAPVGGATLSLPGFTTSQANRFQNFLISEAHVFTPSITNELRLSYNRIALSFPFNPPSALAQTLPVTTIAGVTNVTGSGFNFGIQTNLPQGRIANNYVLQDTVTFIRGSHTIRTGFDLLQQRSRQFAPINERGSLGYSPSTGFTGLANYLDDFGGDGGSANRDFGSPRYYPELFRQAYFAQDRWRVNNALTLTLGVRYENFGNPVNSVRTAAFTGLFNVDPVTLTGPYQLPSKAAADNNNWAPTIGIAYSPSFKDGVLGWLIGDRKTVVRSGYQIGYDSFFNNIASNAAASAPNVVATSTPSVANATTAPRGLAVLSSAFPRVPRALSPLDTQTLVDANLVNPYFQRWSLGVQRELPANLLMDLSYVGSKGTKLYTNEDRNPLVPLAQRITPAGYTGATSLRLDNLQGGRTIRANSGSSSYHAMQLAVNRRFVKGVAVTGAYTFSKLIDNASEVFASGGLVNSSLPIIPLVLGGERNDRAVSLFDRTHRLSITYVWELPFLKGQKGVFGQALGGWQVSGVTTFESGVPFTVANGQDSNGIGGNNDRPDFNPNGQQGVRAVPFTASATNPGPTGQTSGVFYTNPDDISRTNPTVGGPLLAAFIDPSRARYVGLLANTGRTGTLGRNTERTRGTNLFDFTLQKRFRVTERLGLQFRAEMFNAFNRPNYGTASISPFSPATAGPSATVFTSPGGNFLQPQFGDGGGRVVRYLLKLTF